MSRPSLLSRVFGPSRERRRGIGDFLPITLTFALALVFVTDARADIVRCEPISGSYTVYLSEPTYSPAAFSSKEQMQAFLERLQFALDRDRDGKWIGSPATKVRFVACPKRVPAPDGSDFDAAVVETMHTERVLLEMWGWLDVLPAADGVSRISARMNYLLVPMQYATNLKEVAPGAQQELQYPETGAARARDYVELIGRPLDIDAFVAAAFGFKLLREHDRELAHRNLCRASALLGKIQRRTLSSREREDVASLHKFVLESAGRAIVDAKADPTYDPRGVLRLQDPKQPCAGGI